MLKNADLKMWTQKSAGEYGGLPFSPAAVVLSDSYLGRSPKLTHLCSAVVLSDSYLGRSPKLTHLCSQELTLWLRRG